MLFYCLSPTKRHMRCLDLALDHMADVNNVSFVGKPVLLLACEQARDCESMCIALLQRGADPNATNQVTSFLVLCAEEQPYGLCACMYTGTIQ